MLTESFSILAFSVLVFAPRSPYTKRPFSASIMIRTVARYVGAQLMRVSPFFVWIVFRANRLQVVTIKGMHRENSVARPFDDSNACAYIVFQNVAFTPIGAEERYTTPRTAHKPVLYKSARLLGFFGLFLLFSCTPEVEPAFREARKRASKKSFFSN